LLGTSTKIYLNFIINLCMHSCYHIKLDIRDVEDSKSNIECVSVELQIGDKTVNLSIADIRTIDEG
jgi:hypothetical protein